MTKNYIHFLTISFVLFLTLSCKKEVYLAVDNSPCNMNFSLHNKNDLYQNILNKYTKEGVTGLTVVISKPGEENWIGSTGYASIEDNIKMTPCHLHHTASLAKSFTAVVILQLIEEGKLSFDTKIAPYLSKEVKSYVKNSGDITVKQLLQHTSGIPDVFDIGFFNDFMNHPEKHYTTEELLSFNKKKDALYAPGKEHTYSDPNFMLLSILIDSIEGSHIESFKTRIFEPLALENMHYHDEGYPALGNVAANYWEQYGDGIVENCSDIQNSLTECILGADGVIASPLDMVTFYQQVFEGNVLSPEILELVKTDWVEENHEYRMNTGYSHGFMTIEEDGEKWIGHAGLHLGASCYVFYNLNNGTTIGVFTNTGTFMILEKMELIYYDLWNDLKDVIK